MAEKQSRSPLWQARHKIHKNHLHKLRDILSGLKKRDNVSFTAEQLAPMGIFVIADLDVDEKILDDPEPRFFFPPSRNEMAKILLQASPCPGLWKLKCIAGTDEARIYDEREGAKNYLFHRRFTCSGIDEADNRVDWFARCFCERSWQTKGIIRSTGWNLVCYKSSDRDFPPRGDHLPPNTTDPTRAEKREYCGCKLHEVFNESRPHTMCFVCDTEVPDHSEILLSELQMATTAMKRQARRQAREDYYPNHAVLPVLLMSIHHDHAARIMQAHFDGESIFIRHSRTLDFFSDRPNRDAYLMLRWMACQTGGPTEFSTPMDTDEAYAANEINEIDETPDTPVTAATAETAKTAKASKAAEIVKTIKDASSTLVAVEA